MICTAARGSTAIMRRLSLFSFAGYLLIAAQALAAENGALEKARRAMVEEQIRGRGITHTEVLRTLLEVPPHWFVPQHLRSSAYRDQPLPIGEGQTISQPYIVALMTELIDPQPAARVLEIGTGSGYQAAILSKLVSEVYTIEIKSKLYEEASRVLSSRGFANVKTRLGDGYFGWPEAAPFDAVMITAAVDHIPPPLLSQLKEGGRLVLPLGSPFGYQNLVLVAKTGDEDKLRQVTGVLFVPLTGHALKKN